MRRILSSAALLILATAGSAHAVGFTPSEKTSLLHLHQSLLYLTGALSQGVADVTNLSGATTHAAVGQASIYTTDAVDALNDSLSSYLGVTATPAGANTPDPRSVQLLRGAERLTFGSARIGYAVSLWQDAAMLSGAPAYQAAVANVLTNLAYAQAEVLAFDATLAYADVYPSVPTPGNGSHTIVGPHGDFDPAMWKLWRSVHYYARAMYDLAHATQIGSPSGTYHGRPYMNLAQAVRNSLSAQLTFAAVAPSELDRFFAVLAAAKLLTDDHYPATPMMLHFLMTFEMQPLIAQLQPTGQWSAYIKDMSIVADAWKHSDGAAWQLLRFPDCSILNNPGRVRGDVAMARQTAVVTATRVYPDLCAAVFRANRDGTQTEQLLSEAEYEALALPGAPVPVLGGATFVAAARRPRYDTPSGDLEHGSLAVERGTRRIFLNRAGVGLVELDARTFAVAGAGDAVTITPDPAPGVRITAGVITEPDAGAR